MKASVKRMVVLRNFATGSGASRNIAYGDVLSEKGFATFFHLLILLDVFPDCRNKIKFGLITSYY